MNSFKPPSNPLFPNNVKVEREQFLAVNQQILTELITFIDFAEKFTIGFIEINFPKDREILIEALVSHPECQEVEFITFDFPDPHLRFLKDEIVKILAKNQKNTSKKTVLIIQKLENSIGVFGDYPPVLQDLNFVRDAYKKTLPYPILFILPDYALTRLAKFAPDFWAWRSGVFRFKTTQLIREDASAQTLQFDRTIDTLEKPEKQERIDLLHRLLMEYKPTGNRVIGEDFYNYSNILHQLGVAYLSQRNYEKAREYLEEAEIIAKNTKDLSFQAEVLNTLGKFYYQQRNFDRSLTYYQESLRISERIGNWRGEITSLFNLGNTYQELRQFQQATEYYYKCLEIEQQIDDRYSIARTYYQLGRVDQRLKKYEEALQYYQQALEIYIEFDDRYSSARAYNNLGTVAQECKKYEEALQYYQQALEIKLELSDKPGTACAKGDRYSQASTYHNLGSLSRELQDYEKARQYYQQALAIYIEYGDRYSQASTYYCLGTLAGVKENYVEARTNLQKALDIYVEYNDEYWASSVREVLERLP